MPPKKWGTTLNKSYGSKTTTAITEELNREVQYVKPNTNTTTAAHHHAAANSNNTAPSVALNHRPNPNHRPATMLDADPRTKVLAEHEVRATIRRIILDNNLLGLPAEEVDGMVNLILAATSRKEVFDWCSTLMLEERKAVEIIQLRETNRVGSFSSDPTPPPAAAAPSAAAAPVAASAPAAAATAPNSNNKNKDTPSLQSLNQKPPKTTETAHAPKVLTVTGKGATVNVNAAGGGGSGGAIPLNNTSSAPTVGSGTKKRGANAKALANVNQLGGGNSLVVGQFFECGCFAATHNFISNCLNCGRIFCEQEMPAKAAAIGSYAARAGGLTSDSIMCYACGQDPNRNITFEIKVQQGLVDQMAADKNNKGYEEAMARRDQLLQFAKERMKRTTVVDDQGMGGIAYGTNTAWMTEEEVEAMEEKERKRKIAEMHQHSGAYRVHLDIVNQAVCLGATPSAATAEEEARAKREAEEEEARKKASNAWGGANCSVPASVVPSAKPLGGGVDAEEGEGGNTDDANNEGDADDDGFDEDDEGARRILPLPTLLQKLWYTAEDSSANTQSANANKGGSWEAARVVVSSPTGTTSGGSNTKGGGFSSAAAARLASEGPTVLDLKPATHRGTIASKRVQNDYFEDDDLAYRVEKEDFIFKTKKALLAEDAEAEEARKSGVKFRKKSAAAASSSTPAVDLDSFSKNGVGTSSSLVDADISQHNKIGAAMAAGGRVGDEGMCMTLHQPWAGLLVAGVMIHEGRTWPSDFKGRLWIHAAAAKYTENEFEEIVDRYREFWKANNVTDKKIPTNFPTSCLLGYVTVTEVLSRAEYEAKLPEPVQRQSSSESTHIFMCDTGPRKALPFPLPMDGKHKIYKLERKIWGAARKQFGEDL